MIKFDESFKKGMLDEGVAPYGDAPRARASTAAQEARADQDEKGVTGVRQHQILDLLRTARETGMTYREISSKTNLRQGQVTGPLSEMHKANVIARLANTQRAHCSVYVLPEFVNNRATASHGRRKGYAPEGDRLPLLLSKDEADLIGRLRMVSVQQRDKPVPMKQSSIRAILAIIDRALR